jgi:hypothetical protein
MHTRQTRKTEFYHVLEDIEKRGNSSKELKRMFAETENKIKDITSTNTHTQTHTHIHTHKTDAIRKVD